MSSASRFDPELIRRYECNGPRYTSYPTAAAFHTGFSEAAYRQAVTASGQDNADGPLSLYVHIPFCESPCFYCACNKVTTRSADRIQAYLHRLHREIEMQATLPGFRRPVEQLHFGGGTPTILPTADLRALMAQLRANFQMSGAQNPEYSIEVDPRTVDTERIHALADLGFNRISLGVQDVDPAVQRAVNRIQPADDTLRAIADSRAAGFASVSVDLIYGLPLQSLNSFASTLDIVLKARPDRLAIYGYAHMPKLFKPQRRIREEDLPSPALRLELLGLAVERLTAAGYVYIGMDHFALPEDELVRAQRERTLHRNFQGYSTHAECDLVGLGVSSIGKPGNAYAQNAKNLPDYYAAIDAGRLPIHRGITLSHDDQVRAAVIQELMCHGFVDREAISKRFGIDFDHYFSDELQRLRALEADGLVELGHSTIVISPTGRFLMRNVAMVFDAYLRAPTHAAVYSKAI